MAEPLPIKLPHRFLFVASIGNPPPYHASRHSAGHILLRALNPLLHDRLSPVPARLKPDHPEEARPQTKRNFFCKTWQSSAAMNVSGARLARRLETWLAKTQIEMMWKIDQNTRERHLRGFRPTLAVLHDELEAPLGAVRVKRGSAESGSFKGHRGLMSVFQSLSTKGLFPQKAPGATPLEVMRVGVGIGRPKSRDPTDVAEYVLAKMEKSELEAIRNAAPPVLEFLIDELYSRGEGQRDGNKKQEGIRKQKK